MRPGQHRRAPSWLVGLAVLILAAIGSYAAFFKNDLPFGGGTEVRAVFATSQGLRPSAEVRIAGVRVGTVTDVELLEPEQQAAYASRGGDPGDPDALAPVAVATMEIDASGLPLKEDATFELRPRLFLEGNLFVDVHPGSPGAPAVSAGHTFGLAQTAASVKLDRILTTLQGDVRGSLKTALRQLGDGLVRHGGAEGLRRFYASSPRAFRDTSRVNEALGGTEPHDLSRLVANFGVVSRAFARNRTALEGLVTNLDRVSGALSADGPALRRSVAELPRTLAAAGPAFDRLNAAFPPVRALAREILPGVKRAPAALAAGTPLLRELRLVARPREARGLIRDLDPAVPDLARLSSRSAVFMEQVRPLSSCATSVVVPWANDSVSAGPTYPFPALDPVYKETAFALVGAGGESRSGDANGQYVRAFSGGGSNAVVFPPTAERPDEFVGLTAQPILGATPAISSSAKPPYRPDVPCETQEPPDLDAGGPGAPPTQSSQPARAPTELSGPIGDAMRRLEARFSRLGKAAKLYEAGERKRAARIKRDVVDGILARRARGHSALSRRIRRLGGSGGDG